MESGHPVIGRVKPRPTTIGIFLMVRSFLNDLVLFPGALPFLMFLTRSGTRQSAEEPSAVPHSTQVLAVTEDSLTPYFYPYQVKDTHGCHSASVRSCWMSAIF